MVQVIVNGTNFLGTRLASRDPSVEVSNVSATQTQLRFSVTASDAAATGVKSFTMANAAGSVTFSLTLAPQLPRVEFNPQPIALPPDGAPRTFTLVLSNADTIAHSVSLSVDSPSVATVSPTSLTFAPGETSKTIQITGRVGGLTTLRSSSSLLPVSSAPVFVTADFTGVRTAYGSLVGVLVQVPPEPKPSVTVNGMLTPAVGVAYGPVFRAMQPRALLRGQTTRLVVTGANLQGVNSIAVSPGAGVAVRNVTAAADGLSVAADVVVAADAQITPRQVILAGSGGPFRPALPQADRIWVLDGLPVVTSVEPFQAVPGTLGVVFKVRGRNLHTADRITIGGNSNVRISAAFTVNEAGTEITGGMEVPLNARVGSYPIQVTTSAGASDGLPTPFNTFNVVNEIQSVFTPIYGPLVGVVNGTRGTATTLTGPLFTASVGVALGASVTNVEPRVASVGQTTRVTITGSALGGVSAVEITPSTGLTLGALSVAGNGSAVSFDLTAAADAPRTLRRLRVLAGNQPVPMSLPELGVFLVSQPLPVIESVAPVNLVAGDPPLSFTVRGRNLQLLSAIRFEPPTGITVGNDITVSADGGTANVSVTVQGSAVASSRVVVVETPAGASTTTRSVANTVTIARNVTSRYDGIVAPLVGVRVGTPPPPPPTTFDPVLSPLVGVRIPTTPIAASASTGLLTRAVGIALGPIATQLQQTPLVAGSAAGTVTITGVGLGAVTAVQVSPATGIAVGTPTIAAGGTQLVVPITVASDVAASPRQLRLSAGTGTVGFSQAASNVFFVSEAAPRIGSIEPLFGRQGEGITLLIRGANLQYATGVVVEPPDGIAVTWPAAVNPPGTEITVVLRVAPGAPLGARVIRVTTPGGGTTTAVAEPANTFTVIRQ
jgi:hypothetical protein